MIKATKLLKKTVLFLGLTCIMQVSNAQLLLEDYKKSRNTPQEIIMRLQLKNIYDGLYSYNSFLKEHRASAFCIPNSVVIDDKILTAFLDKQIAIKEAIKEPTENSNKPVKVGDVILNELRLTFPCYK